MPTMMRQRRQRPRCGRCDGNLFQQGEGIAAELVCLQCGRSIPTAAWAEADIDGKPEGGPMRKGRQL